MDSFSTPRLLAERLTAAHWLDLRRMDQDERFMALLGGVRDEAGTAVHLEQNLEHWVEHGSSGCDRSSRSRRRPTSPHSA